MNHNSQDIEGVLAENYRRQAACYARALSLAEALLANWGANGDVVGALQRIGAVVEEVALSNAVIEQSKKQWLDAGRKPGPVLAAALQEVAKSIERLRDRIGTLERLAAERKQRLTPELDGFVRGWQMQRAYAAHR